MVKDIKTMFREALELHQAGNLVDAEILYSDILEAQPENIDTIFFLGTLKLQKSDLETARLLLEKAITLKPDHAAAHNNLGSVLKEQGKLAEAVKRHKRAIALQPDYAMAHSNLGNLLKDLGRFDEAEESCRRAISLKPDYADAHNNLGSTLQKQGRHDEAIISYNMAIKYEPESIHAHINRSSALLLTENFKDGWPEYEWRLHTKNCNSGTFHQARWDGSPLNGKTILVHTEQGFGDTIQFIRYLPMIKSQGGYVIFECQKNLIRLLGNYVGIDEIIERSSRSNVDFDTHIHLLSLPGIFGTEMDSIPSSIPYIRVDPVATEQWRIKLANNNYFKIGIVWAGSPTFKDYYRSCHLADFAPLAEIPGITFYSLQKGPASAEVFNPPKNMKIINLEQELSDFSVTAAIMNNMDLIISTDTAAVHLAGAIGKPIWTLLHTSSDWRWFLYRNDCPWYPGPRPNDAVGQARGLTGLTGMRLFRQSKFNDWRGVFDQVKEALISNSELLVSDCEEKNITNSTTQTAERVAPGQAEFQSQKLANLLHEAHKLHKAGDLASAVMFYNKAIDVSPDNAMVHYNVGSALHGSGRVEDALVSYKKSIELKPDYTDAHYNLGNILRQQGKIDKAIISYRQAIVLDPDNAELHCNLGATLQESGEDDEAVTSYNRAIVLNPGYAMAHCNLGSLLHASGKLNDAATSYKRAIELKPDFAMAHNNLGTALKDLGKFDEAVESYRIAIALKPDYAEAYNNLGAALLEQRGFEEAVICHNKAISIKPDYAEAYNNLGTILQELCKLDEAIASYRKAIALKPDYAEAHNNLGTALQATGKPGEALTCFNQATILKPEFSLAHLNMSFAQLLTENFKEGWLEHKWRLNIKGRSVTTSRQQMWDGKSLKDKVILVHTEQGFGDSIQFVRYLPMVKAQGGRVIIECPQSLCRLLRNCNGIDEIIEKASASTSSIQHDVYTHLLDLPGIFDTTLKSIPLRIPYITPDPILEDQWASKLNIDENLRIGIVWAGNPRHTRDRNRSCSMAEFAKLADIPGLSFYSLQKGHDSIKSDNSPTGMKIINLGNELSDFADTAAVIANLDLVISVDTAVAHLAGAIGKTVWTLLPFAPDWRWLLKRNDSPWYPDMRLFRQNQPGDWDGVFEQVKKTLIDQYSLNKKQSRTSEKLTI